MFLKSCGKINVYYCYLYLTLPAFTFFLHLQFVGLLNYC